MRALAFALALAAGCAPTRPTPSASTSGSPRVEQPDAPPTAAPVEAVAPRVCVHDAKDLAPCSEDCDRGIVFACTVVATRIERGDGVSKDLTRAVHLYERACDLRDAPSCVSAARMHASGRGVPPSPPRQIQLLSSACKLGDTRACSIAAKSLTLGTDVPRDLQRAAELRRLGCAGGDPSACVEVEALAP